ncbi:MAG: DNA recombination protein RmuC [Tenericutes bacterium HGW-Tenericutes-2]|jgi:DNA recombination protein RmuC|nr:MAG: DNA recombination protein RmuC [Tenericutes bacterium HGW-Tenericutes-2]
MLEYIIIGLLAVMIIIGILIWVKLSNPVVQEIDLSEQTKAQNDLKLYFQKEYGDLKYEMGKLFGDSSKSSQTDLNTFKENMMLHIDRQMKEINEKVELRLTSGFDKTNKTFTDVIERLGRIDEAQKKIESLSGEVVSLNVLLTDKKTRGIFGEVQLYQLLSAVFGETTNLYGKQTTLSNGSIADAVIHAPEPMGMVAIDSKFPLDNYKRMIDRELGDADKAQAFKDFERDVKKHIDDIKNKYIIIGETSDQAFMFVPAEAIFAEIAANHEKLNDYAQKNRVWIVSPTTLFSTLSMVQMVAANMERDKQAQVIVTELKKLGDEFRRYVERWDKLKKSIDSVAKNAENVNITSAKISTKFKHISDAKFDAIEDDDVEEIEDLIEIEAD